MEVLSGPVLLQAVAERILARYLEDVGHGEVAVLSGRPSGHPGSGVDITYRHHAHRVRVKVKPDPYFGTDPTKIRDRSLVFYRGDAGHYAFESVSDNRTQAPGWMVASDADDIYYYYLAIAQPEDEIRVLLAEPDGVFFGELAVDRDELHVLPMRELEAWFAIHYEEYAPRPVIVGDHAAWYRLVPRSDIERAVAVRVPGPVFWSLASA